MQLLKNAEDILISSLSLIAPDPSLPEPVTPVASEVSKPRRIRFRLKEKTAGTDQCRRLDERQRTFFPNGDH